MTKRLFSMLLVCVMLITACLTAIPTFEAFATFKNGDVVIITECAGGGVSPEGVVGTDYPTYFVSAMEATNAEKTANYFAWCASYTVNVPSVDREYILYGFEGNNKTVVADNKVVCRINPDTGHYEYFDTGLNGYIDFNWALSCIKAAERDAQTTNLSPAQRMVVELAIRERFFPGLAEGTIKVDKNLAAFGMGVRDYLIPMVGDDELVLVPGDPSEEGVNNFFIAVKTLIDDAKNNPVTWSPYADKLNVEQIRKETYEGDDFILFEGKVNKLGCSMSYTVSDPSIKVTLNGDILTAKMPRNKMVNGVKYTWNATLTLPAGINYNMMYGVPKTVDSENPVQNIMVYEVDDRVLTIPVGSNYTPHETASILLEKKDDSGKAMSNVEFTLYFISANNTIEKVNELPTQTTDSSGLVFWSELPLGKYFLVESGKPAGYADPAWKLTTKYNGKADATSVPATTVMKENGAERNGIVIDLSEGGTISATVNVVNADITRDLIIVKTDTEGNCMPGFKFTVYPILPNGSLGTGITKETRSNGYVLFTALELGDYFVVENYEDTVYEPDKPENWYVSADKAEYTTIGGKQGWKITLLNNNASIEAVNKKTVKDLNIVKTDTEGNCMPGFKFTVYPILPNGSLGTGITKETRSDGYVFFTDLELGNYFVVENYEGTGYEPHKPEEWDIDGATNAAYTTIEGKNGWKVLLGPETTNVTVNAVNEQQTGNLTIIKTDLNGTSMPGFNFTVYPITLSGELGTGVTKPTGANGVVTFPTLKVGNYFVVEDYADTDYVPHEPENWSVVADNAEYTTIGGMQGWMVTLSKNGATINAVNKPVKTSLHIEKLNKDGSDPKGFNFTLYPVNDDGSLGEGTRKETELFGDLLFAELELGTYFLVENYEGTGYAPYKQEDWEISGAISALFTTIEGMQGWKLQLGKNNVTIYADNYKADHYITIEKVDTEGNPLAGVPFRFYAVNNGEIVEVTVVVTDTEGKATITLSNPGEFFIAEIAPVGQLPHNPDQWVVTSAKSATFKTINGIAGWHIVLDQDNTHATLKAVNKIQTGEINISKYGEEGLTDGDVFKFEISSDNFPAFSEIITLSTNVENGVAFGTVSNLPLFKADGSFITYTITEIEAPNRFVKAEPQTVTFEAEYKANRLATAYTTSVELTNPLLTRELYINKTSYNNVVEGIEFVLSFAFEDGITQSLTGTTVKTADGIGNLVFTDLPVYNKYGELIVYTLEEKRSSNDFSTTPVFTSNDTEFVLIEKLTLLFTFEQSDGHISVYNPRHPINVVVMKDSEDGAKDGFVFELSDNKGNKWSATTNADGVAIFYKDGSTTEAVELPAYDADNKAIVYTITEKPTEIYDAFVPVSFTVDDVDENNTFTLEAYNTLKRGDLVINKISDTGEKLAGAKFLLEVSKDNGISWQIATADDCSSAGLTDGVLVSDAEHNLVFSGLLMDNKTLYRVTEIKAPEGFNCQTEPVFQGRLTDKGISEGAIIVENTQTPDTGDYGFGMLPFGVMIACIGLMGILLSNKKKRTSL